jgi:aldehyde dehydrogenase (NAD+)
MDARHDEIVQWLIDESGSTRLKAEMEWGFTRAEMIEAATYSFHVEGRILPSAVPGKENRVYRQPLGVVGVISPWNFPMHLSHRTIGPALALGNTVVVKPAEDTPVTGGLLLAKIYEEAGLPPGVLNVVVGDVAEIGDAFTLHAVPKFISFTGSTRVGKHVASLAVQGPWLKRFGLELGGNAPFVVLDDANLDLAVNAALFSRFLHSGQICMSANRIIVDESLYDHFVEMFVERTRTLEVGDPNDPATVIGPVINQRQLDTMLARLTEAKEAGVTAALSGPADGLVLPPHVLLDVANDSALAQAELFGPIAPIIKAHGEAEALQFANATQYGLSSAVFSRDEGRALQFALQVEAGMTHINDTTVHDDANTMFGGEKNSGLGRFNGPWIVAELTRDHFVSVQHTPRRYPF